MSDEEKKVEEDQPAEEQKAEEKKKKINKMTLAEIEKKIEETKKHQGGLYSRYAKELVKQRDVLKASGK
jgi:hypothetical protein